MFLLECTDDNPPMTYIINPDGGMYHCGETIREYITNYTDQVNHGTPLAIANVLEHALAKGLEATITATVELKRLDGTKYTKELTFKLYKEERADNENM